MSILTGQAAHLNTSPMKLLRVVNCRRNDLHFAIFIKHDTPQCQRGSLNSCSFLPVLRGLHGQRWPNAKHPKKGGRREGRNRGKLIAYPPPLYARRRLPLLSKSALAARPMPLFLFGRRQPRPSRCPPHHPRHPPRRTRPEPPRLRKNELIPNVLPRAYVGPISGSTTGQGRTPVDRRATCHRTAT